MQQSLIFVQDVYKRLGQAFESQNYLEFKKFRFVFKSLTVLIFVFSKDLKIVIKVYIFDRESVR